MAGEHWTQYFTHYRQSWLAFGAALLLISTLQWISSAGDETEPQNNLSDIAHRIALAEVPKVSTIHTLPSHLASLATQQDFGGLQTELLEQAMQAVEQQDDQELAYNIALLGIAALDELDIDTASVYLNEALELYEDLDSEMGMASVSLHIGRMHILERRQARRAALAYDTSLLARWKIAHGRFSEAEQSLKNAIEENLALNRNGAAAVDYTTLYTGYLRQGNTFEAETAAISAAHLHAASGRLDKARQMLTELRDQSLLSNDIAEFDSELLALHQDYEDSVAMIGRARDYRQLYNHYIAEDDPVRAWRFRLKANASEQRASKRARYRRQSGVLVLLYNSNDSMQRARFSLQRARDFFARNEQHELVRKSTQLMSEVF